MSARALTPDELVEFFALRAWLRAYLFDCGDYEMIEAVDGLQSFAERVGLVDMIGQDTVQAIMADAFEPVQ